MSPRSNRFAVSTVARSTERLPTTDARGALAHLLGANLAIEACSNGTFVTEPTGGWRWHPFLAAADCAFNRHLPLVIDPDGVWLCIAQGLANALRLEARLAAPASEVLEVRRDDWARGNPDNPWPSIFDDLVAAVRARQPAITELIVAEFSTTHACARAAFAVTLLDAMQDYYSYRGTSLCGIPEVTLLGTADDYRAIRTRVARLAAFGLDWWVPALELVCDRLADAADGRPDVDFFRSLYKRDESSGGPYFNGWMNVLFPFVWHYESKSFALRNEHAARTDWRPLDGGDDCAFEGGKQKAVPLGISRAPLLWRVVAPAAEYRYELLAGFVGVSQDPSTLALRAELGWAVRAR